ncbi:MAG: hypothetical protein ACYSWP_06955 [Planctomycetota bacterium]
MALLVLLNNFLHDFSAAGWVFGSVLLWMFMRKTATTNKPDKLTVDLVKIILFLMRISFVGIVVFGILRTVAYKSYEWSDAAGQGQILLLAIKHVIFTIIFIIGLMYYIKASRFVRKLPNDQSQ